jgi:4-hydroxy-4-methyl-2-oxoglutarate aldolase
MALDARTRGLAGLVVAGAVRDTSALQRLGFPVFATGTCPLPPAKDATGSVGETIVVRSVRVGPGELVVADADGVLVVRGHDSPAVVAAVAVVQARENEIRAALARGDTLAGELGIS